MHIGAEANFLTRLQHLSHVAHPSDLSSAPGKIKLAEGLYSAHAPLPRWAISEHLGRVVWLSIERFARPK